MWYKFLRCIGYSVGFFIGFFIIKPYIKIKKVVDKPLKKCYNKYVR